MGCFTFIYKVNKIFSFYFPGHLSGSITQMLDILKKNLVVFLFVDQSEQRLCWRLCVGEHYGHICLSVCLLMLALNVLTLITLKKRKRKKRSVESEIMHCKYDFKCIACFSGKFHPTVEACFPFLLTFSSALFCSKPCLQNCESRRRPALRFTDMPAYMPYLYKIIFNSQSSNVRTYSCFFVLFCLFFG